MPAVNGLWKIDLAAPHQSYFNRAGKRLVGVTTVLSVLAKPALLGWYASMERDGILRHLKAYNGSATIDETWAALPQTKDGKPAWFAEIKRDKAADVGSLAHGMAEAFLHDVPFDDSDHDPGMISKARFAFERFKEWWSLEGLSVVHSELQLVSERDQVGGTLDIVARARDGSLVLADLKTSKPSKYYPYPEVYGQTGQYASMYEESRGERIARVVIVRIGKEERDPGDTYWVSDQQRAAGKRLFDAARAVYEAKKELERR